MAVYDCFMFYNELDVLEIRLSALSDVVDRFVLVEAAQTHSGKAKPLHFSQNSERYARWRDRIEHVVLESLPESDDAWVRENAQRNGIARGLGAVEDDDLVIISDVDEIPRADVLARIAATPSVRLAGMRMPLFYLRFNYLQIRGGDPVYVWAVAARGEVYRKLGPQGLREARIALQNAAWSNALDDGQAIYQHAGWHFSYLGDDDHVRLKLASFAHTEHATSENLDNFGVDGILARDLDLFGRPGFEWAAVRVNGYFPAELRRDLDRYRHLLVADPGIVIDPALSLERDTLVMRRLKRA